MCKRGCVWRGGGCRGSETFCLNSSCSSAIPRDCYFLLMARVGTAQPRCAWPSLSLTLFHNKLNSMFPGRSERAIGLMSEGNSTSSLIYCQFANLSLYNDSSRCGGAHNCPDTLGKLQSAWERQPEPTLLCWVCAGEVSICVIDFYQHTDKHQGMLTLHVLFGGKKREKKLSLLQLGHVGSGELLQGLQCGLHRPLHTHVLACLCRLCLHRCDLICSSQLL